MSKLNNNIINKLILLVKEGKTNIEISKILKLSPTTVRKYTVLNGLKTNSVKNKPIKETIKLSKEQEEIIFGSLLGDMCISKTQKSARLLISQGGKHEKYFDHLCKKFNNLIGAINKNKYFDNRTNKYYNKFSTKTLANKTYLEIYNIVYLNNIKTINDKWLNNITERSIAYWFMDDGSKNGIFATNCFTKDEVIKLKNMLKNKFNLNFRIKKVYNKNQWILCILPKSKQDFENLIRPYIIDSMKYKLTK